MKTLCKCYGGSQLYGLSTPESDLDIRGIYASTEKSEILGLSKNEHITKINGEEDVSLFELKHFLKLLTKGNSQATELLFNDKWIEKSPEFDLIQKNKYKLIDSEKIFKMLMGYINGEKHIIIGNNTGKLGDKRKSQIEKFGYSYRNCCHALRLLASGIQFFMYGRYPVNIFEENKLGPFILDIKQNPQNYKRDNLLLKIEELEIDLKKSFDSRYSNYKFDVDLANEICYTIYKQFL